LRVFPSRRILCQQCPLKSNFSPFFLFLFFLFSEGSEQTILESFPFETYLVLAMSVEVNGQTAKIASLRALLEVCFCFCFSVFFFNISCEQCPLK
jgi:hypothetical protein